MQTRPKKIGEGTYGCVFNPSMNCSSETPMPENFKNNEYISKFMKKEYAQEELNEFNKFNKIDPNNEYHLGDQIMCNPDFKLRSTIEDISTCENIDLKDVNINPSNYKLLIGKYGGPDLKNFCDKFAVSYFENDTNIKKKHFLLEIYHLLKGLQFFRDNGLVHYDLKPHNILFNLKDGTMKYIDFGLMREKNKIKEDSKQNLNWLGTFHWSYPLDTGFMNRNDFESTKSLTREDIDGVLFDTYLQINGKNTNKNSKYPIKNPESFLNMFNNYLHVENSKEIYSLIKNFKGFFDFAANNPYETVLDKTIDFIDIYGLGFTLKYLVYCLHNKHILNNNEANELNNFLKDMVQFNPLKRISNIDELIKNYKHLLVRLNINIINNDKKYIINNDKKYKKKMNNVTLKQKYGLKPKSSSNEYIYNLFDFVIKCPPDKEFNPKTNRCVKKCDPGYIRTTDFKCKKGKKTKNKYMYGGKKTKSRTKNKSKSRK